MVTAFSEEARNLADFPAPGSAGPRGSFPRRDSLRPVGFSPRSAGSGRLPPRKPGPRRALHVLQNQVLLQFPARPRGGGLSPQLLRDRPLGGAAGTPFHPGRPNREAFSGEPSGLQGAAAPSRDPVGKNASRQAEAGPRVCLAVAERGRDRGAEGAGTQGEPALRARTVTGVSVLGPRKH